MITHRSCASYLSAVRVLSRVLTNATTVSCAAIFLCAVSATPSFAQEAHGNSPVGAPAQARWMGPSLSPDERADLVLKELTLDEKIDLVHGNSMPGWSL